MRHRRMVAPINSVKHYVHQPILSIASGVLASIDVVRSVVAPATSTASQVKEGSNVKAVHLEMWINNQQSTGDDASFTLIVEKAPGNTVDMTVTQSLNLGSYPNKKNVLYVSQGVLAAAVDGAQSVPVIRDWALIPKGKQRMGLDDAIRLHVSAVGALKICGIFTYKEYT